MSIKHVEGSPFDARVNYGVFAFGESAATDVNQLAEMIVTAAYSEETADMDYNFSTAGTDKTVIITYEEGITATVVSIVPLLFFPIIVSVYQFPNRCFVSTTFGCRSIVILFLTVIFWHC